MATPATSVAVSSGSSSSSSSCIEVAPLPPSCLLTNDRPPVAKLVTKQSQLNALRARLVDPITSDGVSTNDSHPRDQLIAALLEFTPLALDVIIVASFSLCFNPRGPVWVSPKVGSMYHPQAIDSVIQRDVLRRVLQRGWCIRQIVGFTSPHIGAAVEFVYGPHSSQDATGISPNADLAELPGFVALSRAHDGGFTTTTREYFRLDADEYVYRLRTSRSKQTGWVEQLSFTTNTGREFSIVENEIDEQHFAYELYAPESAALIGLTGTIIGHVHELSCVFASFDRRDSPLTVAQLAGIEAEEAESSRAAANARAALARPPQSEGRLPEWTRLTKGLLDRTHAMCTIL